MANRHRDTMAPHRYKDIGLKHFRILEVEGGAKDNKEIMCTLTTHPLPRTDGVSSCVPYEALSWTWGPEEPDHQGPLIRIRDPQPDDPGYSRILYVRTNLFEAIKSLRYQNKSRALWVDFVCINQSNKHEKDLQVQLMFTIYSRATNVCIWLGEHKDKSEEAVKFIKEQVNDLNNWESITDGEKNAPVKEQWKAFAGLMDRPWFSRRWIVQELALAKEATVHCGDSIIAWTDFETAVALFEREYHRLAAFYQSSTVFRYDRDYFGQVAEMGATSLVRLRGNLFRFDESGQITDYRYNLTDLVSGLSSFQAKEPHDLIYAVLSLASDARGRGKLKPSSDNAEHTNSTATASKARDDLSTSRPPAKRKRSSDPDDLREHGLKRKAVDAFIKLSGNKPFFTIQYAQPFFLVCKEFLAFSMRATTIHNLDIILRPWAPDSKDESGKIEKLPSWVPSVKNAAFARVPAPHAPGGHQTKRRNASPLVGQSTHSSRSSLYNASKISYANESNGDWYFSDPDLESMDPRLVVTGFVLDRISDRQDASMHGAVNTEWLELGGYDEYSVKQKVPDDLWRTLVGDRGPDGTNTKVYYRKACEEVVASSVEGINTQSLQQQNHPIKVEFLKRIEAVITNRRLFKSEKDRNLGLAPRGAKDGDYICIIRGISVPVVLRRLRVAAGEQHYFQVIGECYLHTMMDGRAVVLQEDDSERRNRPGAITETCGEMERFVTQKLELR